MPTPEQFEVSRSRLRDEIVAVRDARDQYLALFGHSAERVELLNTCARWFFAVIQRVLLRDVILGIARLTDPERSLGKENLVLRSLLADPELAGRQDVAAELDTAVADALAAAEFIRVHRHKYLAHLDHAVAIGDADALLPGLTRAEVDGALDKMEAAYNVHSTRLRGSDVSFSVGTVRGAEALVRALETSSRWQLHLKQQSLERPNR